MTLSFRQIIEEAGKEGVPLQLKSVKPGTDTTPATAVFAPANSHGREVEVSVDHYKIAVISHGKFIKKPKTELYNGGEPVDAPTKINGATTAPAAPPDAIKANATKKQATEKPKAKRATAKKPAAKKSKNKPAS